MTNLRLAWELLKLILGLSLIMAAAIYASAKAAEWLFAVFKGRILACTLCDYCNGEGELPDLQSAAADSKRCPVCAGSGLLESSIALPGSNGLPPEETC